MSLNWNLTNIQNYEEVCFKVAESDSLDGSIAVGEKVLNPVTEALIWATMFTAIGWQVTEQNVEEFRARIRFLERADGPWLSLVDDEGNRTSGITDEDIRAHVGLSTNVSPEPRDVWLTSRFMHDFPDADPNAKCSRCGGEARRAVLSVREVWDRKRDGESPAPDRELLCQDCRW